MNTISIFAQPPYILRTLRRVSSIIRGEQIAAHMQNARLNPEKGYEHDVCIYVKPNVKPKDALDFKFEGHPYLDILDGFELRHLLNAHPHIPVIVFSELDVETMSAYVKNKIIFIPHHHVNFEGFKRERDKITKVGIIGSPGAFPHVPDEIRHGLANRGIELLEFSTFYPRMYVVKFYRSIDVGLVWRPYYQKHYATKPYTILANPFKIVNTSAFGVPTIALDEPPFAEMKDCYIPVSTPEEFLKQLDALRTSKTLYSDMTQVCLAKAEKYHIETIAKLYQELT